MIEPNEMYCPAFEKHNQIPNLTHRMASTRLTCTRTIAQMKEFGAQSARESFPLDKMLKDAELLSNLIVMDLARQWKEGGQDACNRGATKVTHMPVESRLPFHNALVIVGTRSSLFHDRPFVEVGIAHVPQWDALGNDHWIIRGHEPVVLETFDACHQRIVQCLFDKFNVIPSCKTIYPLGPLVGVHVHVSDILEHVYPGGGYTLKDGTWIPW